MSALVISASGLGKRYRIHHQGQRPRSNSLREVITDGFMAPFRRGVPDTVEDFWALQGVSFDVREGEVVGIIGRNGAGKSTMLKILSRITEPSEGRVVMDGRVASLLEVGTGFHPELTGRENIFLNGAILGMTRREIAARFDDIVAFAEVERFIDTPLKRYSSGMYMRLAFAVAAHLEPDILIIDEVLAVGDAEFQKKCLGRMNVAARSGRTLLFVSHNLAAISAVCSRCLVLKQGRLVFDGPVAEAVAAYQADLPSPTRAIRWPDSDAPGDEFVTLHGIEVVQRGGFAAVQTDDWFDIAFDLTVHKIPSGLCVGFEFTNEYGLTLFYSHHTDGAEPDWPPVSTGRNRMVCRMPAGLLNTGLYGIAPKIGLHARQWHVNLPAVMTFAVERTHGVSPFWTSMSDGFRPGQLAPILPWAARTPEDQATQVHGITASS